MGARLLQKGVKRSKKEGRGQNEHANERQAVERDQRKGCRGRVAGVSDWRDGGSRQQDAGSTRTGTSAFTTMGAAIGA